MKTLASKLFTIATLLTGIALNTQGADKQTLCPLMIEDEIDVEEFVTYKGVKVFVCCGTCKKLRAQNPDYYAVVSKKQAPQLAKDASKEIKPMKQLFCPVYADTRVLPKSPSIEHNGKKIYFCKTRAVTRFKSNPAKYEKNLPK